MESVIACSYSLYWEKAVRVIRLCMLRNPWLLESSGGTWLYCVSTSVRVGSGEKLEEGGLLLTE